MVKIGVIKCGNIGISPVLDLILDERADREDLDVYVVGSGPKLLPEQCETATRIMIDQVKPQLILFTSPNTALPGPKKARDLIQSAGIPAIIFSDAPGKKAVEEIAERGMGYVIINADPMIGARRPFLDPTEMVLFNSDVLKIQAITGVINLVVKILEDVIDKIKQDQKPELPQLVITKQKAIEAARFQNPYAQIKALAAFEATSTVAGLNVTGCFKTKGREAYMPIVGAAHELLRQAAKLADEARELEKSNNTVFRMPHDPSGKILNKTDFVSKPT
ncbi:MAG: F420-dependent methylenetetrahydromethanopterin dehydrogenase [Candidatus Helarchaeales archaeon]